MALVYYRPVGRLTCCVTAEHGAHLADMQPMRRRPQAPSLFGELRAPSRDPWWGGGTPAIGADPVPIVHGDRMLLAALVVTAGALAAVVATGHVSALIFDGGWPRYGLVDLPGIVGRVVARPGDPGRAWDLVNAGAAPPGPVAWWATLVLLATGPVVAVVGVRRRSADAARSTGWARARDLRRLHARPGNGRLVLGRAGRRLVAVESRHSLLVLGPTQSGKTTGLAVPAILEWPGPVVATSTKGDLLADTLAWRATLGPVHVFDPAATTPYERAGWSPLAGCETWPGAMLRSWELAMAGKAAVGGTMSLGDFWFASAAKALGPYLLAAAGTGRDMGDVAGWIDAEENKAVAAMLSRLSAEAAAAHAATFRREDRARSSLFQVMQQIVGAYLDPTVAASSASSDIVPAELLTAGSPTLYICAPHHDQARLRPVFAALVAQVLAAVYERSAATNAPLDPPVLLVLDEAANIAPVEDLPTVASTAAALGLQLVTVFQDLAQIKRRYGDAAGTVVNNHRAKLVLPGVADLDTLDLASRLVGDEEVERDSTTVDSAGRRSSTSATQWRRLLAPESACRLGDGEAVLLYGNLSPARLRLRPWYRDRTLRRRAALPVPSSASGAAGTTVAPAPTQSTEPQPGTVTAPVSILEAARARRRHHGGDQP